MSRFITPLIVKEVEDISHNGGGTWELQATLVYQSDVAGGTITVPIGFVTDFASVPRLPVLYTLLGNMAHRAAVVHDWLYTSHEYSRDIADAVLKEASQLNGMSSLGGWLLWAGVRVGGTRPWIRDGAPQPINVLEKLNEISNDSMPTGSDRL